ncbi:hypothetical protein RDI58_026214 [Solanum bulbocastanum]|uniref:Uncharacterized protein n=1 Tax=Solanum bulbocastanum TaxID=147425 RepID=A0AAN8Y341_SOLBU
MFNVQVILLRRVDWAIHVIMVR